MMNPARKLFTSLRSFSDKIPSQKLDLSGYLHQRNIGLLAGIAVPAITVIY